MAFATLQVPFSRPTTDQASLATSLSLIGLLTPVPSGDLASPPEVARCSSVPCRPQTPWCGWVNENAFASIVQARPVPPLADRFIIGSPHRLRPGTSPQALRIPSCDGLLDGHPAFRSTASGGSRSVLAVSSFRFRARLDVSIPSTFSGQRGITPAFGYDAPHPSARGTSTLLNNALLSTRRVGGGAPRRWPPSAAQTARTVFPYAAFTKPPRGGEAIEGINRTKLTNPYSL